MVKAAAKKDGPIPTLMIVSKVPNLVYDGDSYSIGEQVEIREPDLQQLLDVNAAEVVPAEAAAS